MPDIFWFTSVLTTWALDNVTPGVTLSKAQVVRTLVNQKTSGKRDTSYTIVSLFSEYTPQERQQILQDIDKKILMLLDLSEDELPWLNSKENFDEKWSSIIDDIRLVVSKFKYEKLQNERSVN